MSEAAEARILKENVNEGAEQAPGSDGLAAVQNEQEHDETGDDAGEKAGDGAAKPLMDTLKLSALDLDKDKFNLRADLEDDTFVNSVRDNGQLVAIAVRRIPGSERFEVLDGWRRVAALNKLEKEDVLVVVHDDLDDDDAAYRFVLDVNEKRATYNGVDRILAALRLQKAGKDVDDIVDLYGGGRKKRAVEYDLSAAKLDREVLDLAKSEKALTLSHLAVLGGAARMNPTVRKSALTWAKKVVDEGLSVRALKQALPKKASGNGSQGGGLRSMLKERNGGPKQDRFQLNPVKFQVSKLTDAQKDVIRDELQIIMDALDR